MITLFIAENEEKIKEILQRMLKELGNASINIVKQENMIKILKKEELKDLVSLEEKVIALEESLYLEKKGMLYKAILEVIEKPLFEHILERVEGNQLKAAKILGINRNTMRTKLKKLGISPARWKV